MKTNFTFASIWKSTGVFQCIMETVFLLPMIVYVYKNVQSSLNYDFTCMCFFESTHLILQNFKFSFVHLLDKTRTWNFKWNLDTIRRGKWTMNYNLLFGRVFFFSTVIQQIFVHQLRELWQNACPLERRFRWGDLNKTNRENTDVLDGDTC